MRTTITIVILVISLSLFAQNNVNKATKVYYHYYENGKGDPNSGTTTVYHNGIVYLSKPESKIRYFMDFNKNQNVTIIDYDNELYGTITPFDSLTKPTIEDDKDSILGFECDHISFKVFSNRIDVWYTEDANVYGSPYRNYIPDNKALVLKIIINGNRKLIADSIVELIDFQVQDYPVDSSEHISDSRLEELKIRSRYTTLNIFDNDTVNFDPDYWKTNVHNSETGVYHYSKGAVILKKITLPDEFEVGANVFVRLTCRSAGDAYDRTGSVFLISPSSKVTMLNALEDSLGLLPVYFDNNDKKYQGIAATNNYSPPIELMRFFTSFGVGHFNDLRVINNYPWKDEAVYKQDVTSVFPVDTKEVWVGVFIGNYDKGGHRVSLDLDVYPGFGSDEGIEKYIEPIFSTVNIMEMSGQNYGRLFDNDTLEVNFTIPDSIENLQLVYTSTGHGGWGGGDEFNPKLNQIFIDDKLVYSIIPWRTDCATYRLYNPASGNFGNGMSSSDLSRSNWCPATLTPPYFINLKELKPGTHTIKIVIDQGEDEGGSFNHWGITGILTGSKKK